MTSFQVWTILLSVLKIVVSQNLGRIVTNSVKGCTGEIKDYIGAQAGDKVTIHYTGWLRAATTRNGWRKGKQFDSSKGGKPISFELGKGVVVKGWDDGLIGTCEGESLRLEIPSEFAYGDQEVGGGLIPPNSDLIFELTLEKLEKDEIRIVTLEAKRCSSDAKSRSKDTVTFDYEARLPDGTVWATTGDMIRNGNELGPIKIGQTTVKGWDLGLAGMCEGERRRVIIPPNLAYGEKGVTDNEENVIVPPNSVIVIDIKLHDIANRVDAFLEAISSGNLDFGRR